MAARIKALPAADAAAACARWLESSAADARPALGRLLRGCPAAADLAGAEEALRVAITAWRHEPAAEEPVTGNTPRL